MEIYGFDQYLSLVLWNFCLHSLVGTLKEQHFPPFYWNKPFLATVSLWASTAEEIRNYTIICGALSLLSHSVFLLSSHLFFSPFTSLVLLSSPSLLPFPVCISLFLSIQYMLVRYPTDQARRLITQKWDALCLQGAHSLQLVETFPIVPSFFLQFILKNLDII